jgi:hypothetical protein
MGLFDSFLDTVEGAATDTFGEDAGSLVDRAQQMFASGDDREDDGGSSWSDLIRGFTDDDDSDDDDSDDGDGGGGWGGMLSGLLDRATGDDEDEDGASRFSGLIDRATSFLPDDIRDQAEQLFHGHGSGGGWANTLTGNALDALPDSWQSVANAALGHQFGEGGHEGLGALGVGGLELDRDRDFDPSGSPTVPGGRDDRAPAADDDVVTGRITQTDDPTWDDATEVSSRPGDTHDDADGVTMTADPTFPTDDTAADDAPAPWADPAGTDASPAPMDDFQQTIREADEIDDDFDDMLEGIQ